MVDCPNRKGIQSAAFMLSVSLSGPRGLDLLAPIPWVVQVSGGLTLIYRESTVHANGVPTGTEGREKRVGAIRQVNYFFFKKRK